MATSLLRALVMTDVERAEELGCLELVEEDVSLCTFVDAGKTEFGLHLRNVLEILEKEGCLPNQVIACVGGGSNSIGMFSPHLDKDSPELIGVEAGGRNLTPGNHASRMIGGGRPAIAHGYKSLFLTTKDGQIADTHSISAGLDYPGVGPEHSYLKKTGRVTYVAVTDSQANRWGKKKGFLLDIRILSFS